MIDMETGPGTGVGGGRAGRLRVFDLKNKTLEGQVFDARGRQRIEGTPADALFFFRLEAGAASGKVIPALNNI
jgi:hypothetical protein